jgi:hypothetical protein
MTKNLLSALVFTAAMPISIFAQNTKVLQAVDFSIASENLNQFGFALDARVLAERVRTNLCEWEFPLSAQGPFTHTLQAKLGKVSRRETPVGFSFSSGNSDPRAADFQKADVLPVTCTLRDADTQELLVERESAFSANALDKDTKPARIVDKLVDQIGTACLDVLEHAPRIRPQGIDKRSSFKPKWMPDVRVEVRETPITHPVSDEPGQTPTVAEEPKKEVIIHNQGTPVIFTFGHERK